MIERLPPVEGEVGLRQEARLDARGQVEILLERVPFIGRQMVEAGPQQRIGQEPIWLHGLVADVAETVVPLIEALQGRIDLLQEAGEAG